MNIILFGPPGVGKSTLIGVLKTLGERAIDLEDVYPNNIRFNLPNMLTDCFIGGADLNPQRKYSGCRKVLIYLEQPLYVKRRAQRDSLVPGKQNQMQHNIEDWKNGVTYDYIIYAKEDPISTAKQLISHFKEDL